MRIDFEWLLTRTIIALPYVVGGVILCFFGYKRIVRYINENYLSNSKGKFVDNLLGSVFLTVGISCLVPTMLAFRMEEVNWATLPLTLLVAIPIIPIMIIKSYCDSLITRKFWSRFLPDLRHGDNNNRSKSTVLVRIDPSNLKLPRRMIITAALVALLAASITFIVLQTIDWNGRPIAGVIFRGGISGLMGVGTFMLISSAALSRRIQKLRDGEVLDD